jgi:hypothetical protein
MVRLKRYRVSARYQQVQRAATKIQSVVRFRQAYKRFPPKRRRLKKLNRGYRALLVCSRPKLRLGNPAKVIQKYARRFVFMMRRHYACIEIQRMYRGHYYRRKVMLMIYRIHTEKVNKIKRAYYIYQLRLARKAEIRRRHMAAYKIWVSI